MSFWDNLFSSGGGGGGGGGSGFMGGLGGLLGGLFGNSGQPYEDAMKEYSKWAEQAAGAQNPFYSAGIGGMQNYQKWLQGMQDPTKFMNNLMGQYQESPWAKYQQQQGMRAANNIGSASGMTGSTPLMQQAQQNAQNISSGDMNDWISKVLGINNTYGQGEANLMGVGQHAADQLSDIYQKMGTNMGQGAYGERAGRNQDFMNMLGGLSKMFGAGGGMGGNSGDIMKLLAALFGGMGGI